MQVLLVEDDRAVMMVTTRHIESFGHTVIQALDGESGVEQFQQHDIDLVIMDYMLPGIDGAEATKRIRALKPDSWFPIIFITSADNDEYLTKGLAAGGDDYIFKPVSPIVIEAKLKAMKRIIDMNDELMDLNDKLSKLTFIDSLTDVLNRRGFDKALESEWSRMLRSNSTLALLIIDIDSFKEYNDCYGHQRGDKSLQAIAATLKSNIYRPADAIARYGGEEFAVILADTDLEGAEIVAKRLIKAVNAQNIEHKVSKVAPHLTISVGVSHCKDSNAGTHEELIKLADERLYLAKSAGRNQFKSA